MSLQDTIRDAAGVRCAGCREGLLIVELLDGGGAVFARAVFTGPQFDMLIEQARLVQGAMAAGGLALMPAEGRA